MKVNIFKYFIISVAAMSIACSCNKSSPDTPAAETPSVIAFSNVTTKATVSDLQKNGFGVWAFINNAKVTNELILENAKVTYNSGAWEYSPLRYWVNESVFTFLAAYPYSENNEGFTLDPSNSSLNLTLSETPAKEDYLIATNVTDTSVEGFSKTVDLQFSHALTSVRLNIWRDGVKHQNDQMRVRKVTLRNIRKAGTYSSSTGWTPDNDKLTLEKIYEGGSDVDNIGAAVLENGALETGGQAANPFDDMMLIPQTLDGNSPVSLKIQYELKRQNAANWETAELETVLPSVTWEPNRRYTYNVVLSSVTDITVYYIQTKVDPWGTPQVGGTVIIK